MVSHQHQSTASCWPCTCRQLQKQPYLAQDDGAREDELAVPGLDAQVLGIAVALLICRTTSLLRSPALCQHLRARGRGFRVGRKATLLQQTRW